jgi:hypothetical protein
MKILALAKTNGSAADGELYVTYHNNVLTVYFHDQLIIQIKERRIIAHQYRNSVDARIIKSVLDTEGLDEYSVVKGKEKLIIHYNEGVINEILYN